MLRVKYISWSNWRQLQCENHAVNAFILIVRVSPTIYGLKRKPHFLHDDCNVDVADIAVLELKCIVLEYSKYYWLRVMKTEPALKIRISPKLWTTTFGFKLKTSSTESNCVTADFITVLFYSLCNKQNPAIWDSRHAKKSFNVLNPRHKTWCSHNLYYFVFFIGGF